jgi:hypothetical protein
MQYEECWRATDSKANAGRTASEDVLWTLSVRRILLLGAASWLIPIAVVYLLV